MLRSTKDAIFCWIAAFLCVSALAGGNIDAFFGWLVATLLYLDVWHEDKINGR